MQDDSYLYPGWLGQDLIEDSPLWEEAQVTTIHKFLAEYSLRDSYCVGFWINGATRGEVTLIVEWDQGLNGDDSDFLDEDLSLLLLRFHAHQLYLGSVSAGNQAILDVTTEPVLASERAAWFKVTSQQRKIPENNLQYLLTQPLYHTIVEFIGDQLNMIHGEQVWALCLSRSKDIIPLPNL
ncbi:MAG: hypothetical protein IT324_20410 [Anaerolineae bacterium]|nr:hypothetical protein [Anaerolineae bacterium]